MKISVMNLIYLRVKFDLSDKVLFLYNDEETFMEIPLPYCTSKSCFPAPLKFITDRADIPSVKNEEDKTLQVPIDSLPIIFHPIKEQGIGAYIPYVWAYIACLYGIIQIYITAKTDECKNIVYSCESLTFSCHNMAIVVSVTKQYPGVGLDIDFSVPQDAAADCKIKQEEMLVLKKYFVECVAPPPFKPWLLISFIRSLKFPVPFFQHYIMVLNDSLEYKSNGVSPYGVALTVPAGGLTTFFSLGAIAVAVRSRGFLTIYFRQRSVSTNTERLIHVPVIYDFDANTIKVVEQSTLNDICLKNIKDSLEKFQQTLKHEPGQCILYPCVLDIVKSFKSVN